MTAVVSVQNRYNVGDRSSEPMVDLCEQETLAFLPWAPIEDADGAIPVLAAAQRHRVSPRQVALAWLLTRSPQVLPIPGSGSPGPRRAEHRGRQHRAHPRGDQSHHHGRAAACRVRPSR